MSIKSALRIAIISSLFGCYSISSFAVEGNVNTIITGGPVVYFKIVGATYSQCAANQRYVVDTNTALGKNTYSLILSAYMAGKPVGIISAGSCNTLPGDAEDINNAVLP